MSFRLRFSACSLLALSGAILFGGCGSEGSTDGATAADSSLPTGSGDPIGSNAAGAPNPGAPTANSPANGGGGSADTPIDVSPGSGGASGAAPTPSGDEGGDGGEGADNGPTPVDSGGAGGSDDGGEDQVECAISVTSEVSEAIATVGIVTFSTDLASIESARIEFGLDTTYGMTAPVDLNEPDYRTLLLGMKQTRDYHFRVIVESGGTACASEDQLITTGSLPNILPELDVTTTNPEALAGGFVMTGQYQARGGDTSPAYVIDADGDYVWALAIGNYVTGVRQSYDGKYMWINGTDNTAGGEANIHRVTMDGLVDEDLSEAFGFQDHSITVLPDESVIFYGHEGECAEIKRRYPDGTIEQIINSGDAHGAEGACHVNAVEYSPEDETLIFSDDLHNNYTKITLDGEVVWVLGGTTSDFTGDGAQWTRQHGIDVLGIDRFLYFNNGEMQGPDGAIVRELVLDLENMTATRVWNYQADPPISNQVLGDVQRLDNGNTVVAYSAQGILRELDPEGNIIQEIAWPLGGAFGYIVKRLSLYGPPPR